MLNDTWFYCSDSHRKCSDSINLSQTSNASTYCSNLINNNNNLLTVNLNKVVSHHQKGPSFDMLEKFQYFLKLPSTTLSTIDSNLLALPSLTAATDFVHTSPMLVRSRNRMPSHLARSASNTNEDSAVAAAMALASAAAGTTAANTKLLSMSHLYSSTGTKNEHLVCTSPIAPSSLFNSDDRNSRKNHRCDEIGCNKVYTKSSHLKTHKRTHTGKRA